LPRQSVPSPKSIVVPFTSRSTTPQRSVGQHENQSSGPVILGGSPNTPTTDLSTHSIHHITKSDPFDVVETCSSDPNVTDERGSISTITAGPSVQLVERMSAAIRRLESEKMAAKDELDRVSSQRNEARGEIAALMREVECGKVARIRVTELQAEVAAINSRYQTTLEMLGEKSELVDELKADVEDVKSMYRDLIERTVK